MTLVAGWFYIKASLGPTPTAETIAFASHAVDLFVDQFCWAKVVAGECRIFCALSEGTFNPDTRVRHAS
jgi:hypothetical protein